MPENEATSTGTETGADGGGQQEQSLTQADVDRIVKDRVARVQAKYADYEELKVKAEGAKTVEEKLAELEGKYSAAEARALRSDVAAKYGLSVEDRDLFLTGTDEATLTAQAKRLADREADRKKQGNVAPKEGATDTTGGPSKDLREFTKGLFGAAD
ncbi:hypothetical protein [Plantibacter sp. M259]|uniref:hypothetical protein n=1 Tax=Plantibacter sp. M259 TaxID=2583822 RepID=UPI0011103FFD|nr:hypothetical protein [Plantibacter sp. M259]